MLSEFAFTPSIFDENAHDDKEAWCDQIRELITAMFPRTSAWPVVVSDLYAGAWLSHVVPYVDKIQDPRAKKYCQEFLTRIKRRLVIRPECGDWPHESDVAWCREAIATNTVEPIERIVSIRPTKEQTAKEFKMVRTIDEVEDSGFWRGIDSDASPKMDLTEQANLLRKLCLHSQWVAVINPYGFGNEQDFTLRLLDIALKRDSKFGPIHFELHSNAPDVTDENEKKIRQQNLTNNMTRKIEPKLSDENTVVLYFWPKILDRILIAGNYVKVSDGNLRKSPRWGVSMSHVAQGNSPDATPTEWKLLRDETLSQWFQRFSAEEVPNRPKPIRITAT